MQIGSCPFFCITSGTHGKSNAFPAAQVQILVQWRVELLPRWEMIPRALVRRCNGSLTILISDARLGELSAASFSVRILASIASYAQVSLVVCLTSLGLLR